MPEFEAVIGLEVHVHLATKSKLFCSCSTAFGQPPNSNVCEVCSGMPGALPSPNREAIHLAAVVGMAANCKINRISRFARKNYFYPDLPAGYQISQFDLPICEHGSLEIAVDGNTRKIGITRIHMENDAGKNIHSGIENLSYVDLNRAGCPLIEIVSEPDLRTAREAVTYLKTLHELVTYLGASDGNMEEGSFRCDANVSIRPVGSGILGTRTELKNLNSFRHVQKAIEYEIARQEDLVLDGKKVVQETRLFDAAKNVTHAMRGKEEAEDYRYFPDPDILPVAISETDLQQWRDALPELPRVRCARFMQMAGLAEPEAALLVQNRPLADFFETAAQLADAKKVSSYLLGPIARECNNQAVPMDPGHWRLSPQSLAELVNLVNRGIISTKIATDILPELLKSGTAPEEYVRTHKLAQVSDTSSLEAVINEIMAANPDEVRAYRDGKTKLLGFFVGQVMRATKGKANPAVVNDLLGKKLSQGRD